MYYQFLLEKNVKDPVKKKEKKATEGLQCY